VCFHLFDFSSVLKSTNFQTQEGFQKADKKQIDKFKIK